MSLPQTEAPPRATGDADAPAQLDARLADLPLRAQRLLREARRALDARDVRQADALLERGQGWAGDHPEYLRLFAIARQLQGRPAEAVAALRRAVEKPSMTPGAAFSHLLIELRPEQSTLSLLAGKKHGAAQPDGLLDLEDHDYR